MDYKTNDELPMFSIFSDDETTELDQKPVENKPLQDETLIVEAIQIVRLSRTTMGNKREVLDTIKVSYPTMTYERALKNASHKAKMLGNCMVVEKIERIVAAY